MESVMLIAPEPNLLPVFKQKLLHAFPTAKFSGIQDRFVLGISSKSRIYLEYLGTDLEGIGWKSHEIDIISQNLPAQHHVYSIEYHSIKLAKAAIICLADRDDIMVDNDCGDLLVGSDLVRKIRNNPDWDWFEGSWE